MLHHTFQLAGPLGDTQWPCMPRSRRFTGLQVCSDCESMAEYVKDEGVLTVASCVLY
jgi:hypothetical protein